MSGAKLRCNPRSLGHAIVWLYMGQLIFLGISIDGVGPVILDGRLMQATVATDLLQTMKMIQRLELCLSSLGRNKGCWVLVVWILEESREIVRF